MIEIIAVIIASINVIACGALGFLLIPNIIKEDHKN